MFHHGLWHRGHTRGGLGVLEYHSWSHLRQCCVAIVSYSFGVYYTMVIFKPLVWLSEATNILPLHTCLFFSVCVGLVKSTWF